MNSYALDSDSSRWWWPQAAAGAVGAAAITMILVLPATGADGPSPKTRDIAPNPATWFATADPDFDRRPCFLTHARWNVALDQPQPRCGYLRTANPAQLPSNLRPGLDPLP